MRNSLQKGEYFCFYPSSNRKLRLCAEPIGDVEGEHKIEKDNIMQKKLGFYL